MTNLQEPSAKRRWYQAIGPGLITACVVIGPGSILTSSKVGADQGYSMLWVVITACIFMMFYMQMGARLGVVSKESPAEILTRKAGRWLAVMVGLGVFFISTAFQFGNNLGVQSAFDVFLSSNWSIGLVIGFNALSISFLFFFKNFYQALEKLMMCFVGLMLTCFAINLAFAGPEFIAFTRGLIPTAGAFDNMEVLGLVGTTFVVAAAYFQAYLAKQKGWSATDLNTVIIDARVGSVIMVVITIMLMSTAAAVLAGQDLENVEEVAAALEPAFGSKGKILFCVGLFSAAYSSFLVNSMIAGFILSDGLALGSNADSNGPKILTTVVLLTGMTVALLLKLTDMSAVPAVVSAQAVTVIAGPLIAGVLLWLTNSRDVMGDRTNGLFTNIFGVIGFIILLAIAYYVATEKVPAGLKKMGIGNTESITQFQVEISTVDTSLNKPAQISQLPLLENILS
ncbi:MAG: Nramp family divalent metal transporter [Planctomycetaceae bacterium]|jgi:manganese transport protein|nr:Nramp family divalent metal transporter [Planctomycetaceae bacterium]